MATSNKVVHLHFLSPVDGKHDFYFGSLAAIYDKFTSDQIGISYNSLTTHQIGNGGNYMNKICIINVGYIYRKRQERRSDYE